MFSALCIVVSRSGLCTLGQLSCPNFRAPIELTSESARREPFRTCEDRGGRAEEDEERVSTPESFWNAVFPAWEANAMAEKHAWLRCAVLDAPGSPAPEALREAARRWPGSLRECQRVEPGRYRAREQWALRGASSPDRARAAWLAEGQAAVCLWSELHRLTGDVLAFRSGRGARARGGLGAGMREGDRRASGSSVREGPEELLRDLTLRDPERREAWPEAEVLRGLGSGGVGPSLAEAWLAHRVGWDRATLRACLLDLDDR
jgi:hypothetical protein